MTNWCFKIQKKISKHLRGECKECHTFTAQFSHMSGLGWDHGKICKSKLVPYYPMRSTPPKKALGGKTGLCENSGQPEHVCQLQRPINKVSDRTQTMFFYKRAGFCYTLRKGIITSFQLWPQTLGGVENSPAMGRGQCYKTLIWTAPRTRKEPTQSLWFSNYNSYSYL